MRVRWQAIAKVVALVAIVMLPVGFVVTHPKQPTRFCQASLALVDVEGAGSVPLQDQGAPGPDGCDHSGSGSVGYDCQYDGPEGHVTVTPNLPDGRCGKAPYPR